MCLPFVEVISEKVLNLSQGMLEMSTSTSIKKDTAEKKVGTDALPPPERSSKNSATPNDIGQERKAP